MIGMGAYCICCKTKNASGTETAEELLVRFPRGCHACSTATGTKADITREVLKETIAEKGYAFLDEERRPLRFRDEIQRGENQ